MQLDLTDNERKKLRKNKIKLAEILDFSTEKLSERLDIPEIRGKEIRALAAFQQIPSVGIKFAQDLIFLGYYSLEELKDEEGATLLNAYEKKKGYKTDPCVEDQFWLVVDYAKNPNNSKRWWDFTADRKKYRKANGYPNDRPEKSWTTVYGLD